MTTKTTKDDGIAVKVDPCCPPGQVWIIAANADRRYDETDQQYYEKVARRTSRVINVG